MEYQTVESFRKFVNVCDPVLKAGFESVLTGKEAKVANLTLDVDIKLTDELDSEFVKPLVSLSPILGVRRTGQIRVVSDKAKNLIKKIEKHNLTWEIKHNGWCRVGSKDEVFYLTVKA